MYEKNIQKLLKELNDQHWTRFDKFSFIRSHDDYLQARLLLEDLTYYDLQTADQLSDAITETADAAVYSYTVDLIDWLKNNQNSMEFTDQALEEFGPFKSTDRLLATGQYLQNIEILDNLRPAIERKEASN